MLLNSAVSTVVVMFRRIIGRDNHKCHVGKDLKGDVRSLFEELFQTESGRPRIFSGIRLQIDKVLNQRSVQNNTTALLALRCALYHTILTALTCKSYLFYLQCLLFGFKRNKYSNVYIACL